MPQQLPSVGSIGAKEDFPEVDEDMEDSEASELNERLKKVSSTTTRCSSEHFRANEIEVKITECQKVIRVFSGSG